MKDFLAITSALADENRLRILLALRKQELCVCQITELLALATSTVSKHISILRQAGLVEARKQGRWIYCRLADEAAPELVRQALAWTRESLMREGRIREDVKRLGEITCQNLEDLCKNQRSRCCSSAPATPVAVKWPKGGRESSRGK